jgi:hypothetical protein
MAVTPATGSGNPGTGAAAEPFTVTLTEPVTVV